MANIKSVKSKENEKNLIKVVLIGIALFIFIVSLVFIGLLTKTGALPNIFRIKAIEYDPSFSLFPPGPYIYKPETTHTSSSTSSATCYKNPDPKAILPFICPDFQPQPVGKPVLYLYPTKETNVNVNLIFDGKIFVDYPKYDESIKGWNVKAYPDGKIINSDGKEYSYIFWEGNPSKPVNWDLSTGFVVKREDTVEFLQNTLSKMGLTPKEYNEFIVYWYPKMKENKYNLIHFAGEEYTSLAKLTITPTPDSELRVFMLYKALDEKIDLPLQEIKPFERKGFSVIEWGGSELGK